MKLTRENEREKDGDRREAGRRGLRKREKRKGRSRKCLGSQSVCRGRDGGGGGGGGPSPVGQDTPDELFM